MQNLIINRIKVMTADAKYGSMRWNSLYEYLNENKKLSRKVLRTTKLFDLFDFANVSDSDLIEYFELVLRKFNMQM